MSQLSTDFQADPTLPPIPSLKQELKARSVPGAEFFPDEAVETYSIEGDRLDVRLRSSHSIQVDKATRIILDRHISGDLVDGGIKNLSGVSATKKVLLSEVKAKILSIRVEGRSLIVTTDNVLAPRIELEAGQLLA